ncbi:MAG TPA: N-acetyltransferase, partial [Erythrobacter sp.]|nr:N-acetyltransferase [Erythrobacter sp.]
MAEFRHETDRLILRDWREEDWPFFWEGTNTPGVMRWLGGVCDGAKRDAAQQRLLSYEREHGHTFWCVERRSDGAILGFCGLKRSNQTGGPLGMMEVGWRLREDAWGRGYAKEAATASLDLAFDRFDAEEVIAMT